jgi:hypothetical protein
MGLDVTYYTQVKFEKPNDSDDYDGYEDGFERVYHNTDFPGRCDDVPQGWYSSADSESVYRRAYSAYNRWRDELAKVAGWPEGSYEQYGTKWPSHAASAWAATEGPFWELIHFTDCDGTIGTLVSQKLAKDFADFQSKADAVGGDFAEIYAKFRKAFEAASDGGFVKFH